MAVFRVERNKGYTVMSNHHLRNKELSLKAKGLLSQMLSLPEDWDYTLAGLSFINREKIDAIREAVKELERAGYIVRSRERDEKGRLRGADYVIFEQPQTPPVLDLPTLENPTLDNPTLEKPTQEKPTLENPTQLNKDIQKTNLPKKEKSNIDLSSTDSIPIHSLNPLPYDGEAAEPPERKRKEATDAYSVYEEIIKDNIEYDHFVRYDALFASALCRAKADWIIGINATRLFSCLYNRTLNVGRVQTPTLKMLVDRDAAISTFKKEKYYHVRLDLSGAEAASGKICAAEEAKELKAACEASRAVCTSLVREKKTTAPPKLFDLTSLQREANRIYGYTAKQTLDLAQALYEKKLLTYLRVVGIFPVWKTA